MESAQPPEFTLEDVTVGPFAHGYGTTAEGEPFAFRTVRTRLTLEIYRPGTPAEVPGPEDVRAVAAVAVTDVDLTDVRSVRALVRDLIPDAEPIRGPRNAGTTIRALLARMGAVLERRDPDVPH
ncbi:MAG: hypothetical protein J2P18_18620 [Nocardia sp.]|nr:hypothetical protein [Nocardia sp.]